MQMTSKVLRNISNETVPKSRIRFERTSLLVFLSRILEKKGYDDPQDLAIHLLKERTQNCQMRLSLPKLNASPCFLTRGTVEYLLGFASEYDVAFPVGTPETEGRHVCSPSCRHDDHFSYYTPEDLSDISYL